MYSVYEITNKINGKQYIGITSRSIEERFQEHISRARCGTRGNRLYAAMRKYGCENFSVKLLLQTKNEDDVREKETVFIKQCDSYKNGYNCNLGGHGFLVFPDEIKAKISKAHIGKIFSIKTRQKMSAAKRRDPSCAKNFGKYVGQGSESPLSMVFKIQFPDGHIEIIRGLRKFCRDNGLNQCSMSAIGRSKGFVLLERFRDYSERKYTQAGGSGARPSCKDEDIVRSVQQCTAVR